jgi:hypothetical protein
MKTSVAAYRIPNIFSAREFEMVFDGCLSASACRSIKTVSFSPDERVSFTVRIDILDHHCIRTIFGNQSDEK